MTELAVGERRSAPDFARPAGPGLAGSFAVWSLWLAVAAATWATNARVPVDRLYAVRGAGIRAGAGRVLVLLGWPVGLVAVAIAAIAVDRLLRRDSDRRWRRLLWASYVTVVSLCATIVLPGAIDEKQLDGKLVNAPAAVGVALALLLSVLALRTSGWGVSAAVGRLDLFWLLLFAVLLGAAIPWLLANVGVYAGDVPGLREVFMSKQVRPEAGYPHLYAVHLGNHDGLSGLLLALSAVVLAREVPRMRRLRRTIGIYLAILVAYGLGVAANDWWGEQVVKRGWSAAKLSSFIRPSLSPVWLAIVLGGLAIWAVAVRQAR